MALNTNRRERDMQRVELDRELAEEVDRRISQQLMGSVLPHLKLVQEEVAMNTALISELSRIRTERARAQRHVVHLQP